MSKIFNCTNHSIEIPNIVSCEGIYLLDGKGKRYMDLESGVWCTSLGHGNVRINSTIKKQIETFMHAGFCYSGDIVENAADSVLSVTGFENGNCVFLCSGSEAIELARQISKHVTGKKQSMTLHDSYLGSYSSVTDRKRDWYIFNWEACMGCPHQDHCDIGCEKLKDIPGDISDFIFEPGSSSGFVRFPPKALIQNIVAIVRSQGGKIIANEVTTGTGRTGKWFGYDHYQIKPDMVAIGKGIGNGYPVSVTAINEETVRELKKGTFRYMQSHQNDPLGAAIVKEVITIIKDEDLIPKAEIKGKRFFEMLASLKDKRLITDVRGRGLMFAVEVCDEGTGDRLFKELIARGYIVGNRKTFFRIDPPLTVQEKDFYAFTNEFRSLINHTQTP
jgi:acetylornithine aminotransferase